VNGAIRVIGKESPKGINNGKRVGLAGVNRSNNCSPSYNKKVSKKPWNAIEHHVINF